MPALRAEPRPRRRPRQSRSKDKVEAILDAADGLLVTMPVADLVLRDVARRAEVKPATLYDYFATKELLLRALEDRAWARAAAGAASVIEAESRDSAPPLDVAIVRVVETFMTAMAPAAKRLGLTPDSPHGSEQRALLGARFAAFAAASLGSDSRGFREGDLALRMRIATSTVAMLTWVGARDHAAALADGSYGREVGYLIAHYFVRD